MPLVYRIDEEHGIIFRWVKGRLNLAMILECFRTLLADPAFRPGLPMLTDFRGMVPEMTALELNQSAVFIQQHAADFGACRWAVIVDDTAAEVLSMKFSILSKGGPIEYRCFHSPAAACQWLGRPEAYNLMEAAALSLKEGDAPRTG